MPKTHSAFLSRLQGVKKGLNLFAQGVLYNLLLVSALSVLAVLYHHEMIDLPQLCMVLGFGAVAAFGFFAIRKQQKRQVAMFKLIREMEQNQNQLLMQIGELEEKLESFSAAPVGEEAREQGFDALVDDRGVHRMFSNNLSDVKKPVPTELSRANEISDVLIEELMESAIRKDHIDIFLQPAFTLPQRKLAGYEVYSRIKTGANKFIPAARYLPLAHKKNVLPELDRLQIRQVMHFLMHNKNVDLLAFCNVSVRSLMDHAFMSYLIGEFRENRPLARQFVFELPAADIVRLRDYAAPLMDGLVKLGCRFSVDGWSVLRDDPALLEGMDIHFVKISAEELPFFNEFDNTEIVEEFLSGLRMRKISCVIKNLEENESLKEALDFDIAMAQGKILAEPAPLEAIAA